MPYRGGPLLSYPQKYLTIPTDGSHSSLHPRPEHDDRRLSRLTVTDSGEWYLQLGIGEAVSNGQACQFKERGP